MNFKKYDGSLTSAFINFDPFYRMSHLGADSANPLSMAEWFSYETVYETL